MKLIREAVLNAPVSLFCGLMKKWKQTCVNPHTQTLQVIGENLIVLPADRLISHTDKNVLQPRLRLP